MITFACTEEQWNELSGALRAGVETAGVILAGRAETDLGLTLLARSIRWVPDQHYIRRDLEGLSISSSGYVPALKAAAHDESIPIFFHTHPRGFPQPSDSDDRVDEQLESLFPVRSRQKHYVSLIIAGTPEEPSFTGRVYVNSKAEAVPIDRLRVVGRRWRVLLGANADTPVENDFSTFDRQVRAFGVDGQRLLGRLRIGVVGAGGTGSAVCEQLIRLGVGSLTVIDDDVLTESNLTRVHESRINDVGRPKVNVVSDEANRLPTRTSVTAITGNVARESVARELRDCDVLFGCTDDHAGRAVLSRLAYWYLSPLIDVGFVIQSTQGRVGGLFGRVTTVMPGEACLICRGRIDPSGVRNQLMNPEERQRLAAEGYAPELGAVDPSVITYTTMVATFGVNELLDRLFGYGGDDVLSELLIRVHDRRLNQNRVAGQPGHYCTDRLNWGRGDEAPLLSQMWP